MARRNRYPPILGRFPNYYELLGVPQTASQKEIHLAYKRIALREHPDKAGNTPEQNERFAAINNVKDILTDEDERLSYDRELQNRQRDDSSRVSPRSTRASQYRNPFGDFTFPSTPASDFSQTFKGNTEPFGSGAGFGPERNASKKPDAQDNWYSDGKYRWTGYGFQSYENSNTSAGCRNCGSLFCRGQAYRNHANQDDVPCDNRGPQWTAPPPSNFGQGSQGFSHAATECNHNPSSCPVHSSHNYHASSSWSKPRMEGDPNYVDITRSRPFSFFVPPASAYDRRQHNGTKPDSTMWRSARWRCFSLAAEHQYSVRIAFAICDHACKIEQTGCDLVTHCSKIQCFDSNESLQRLSASLDLINEIMHFAAASYRYYTLIIDAAAYRRPDLAIPQLIEVRNVLETMCSSMLNTKVFLQSLADQLVKPYLEMTAEAVLHGLRSVVVEWDRTVILPDNFTQGGQDVFFSREGRFENVFERKTCTTGYPQKPFLFREPVRMRYDTRPSSRPIWTSEAEQPTLRRWEIGQRTREAQMDQDFGSQSEPFQHGVSSSNCTNMNQGGPEYEMTG